MPPSSHSSTTHRLIHTCSSMEVGYYATQKSTSDKLSTTTKEIEESAYQAQPSLAAGDLYQSPHHNVDDSIRYVGSWTSPSETPQQYQHSTSPCQFHVSMKNNTTMTEHYHSPIENWLAEDVRDEGSLSLQKGVQLHGQCTCSVYFDGIQEA
ncbi:hypothetical protein B0O99DRAFT_747861 [Bisporella sp. PMI_857]|nr:hypothetical protein B0O99DRAFT_747861 [Bisporella sp. PMI_857]